MKDAVLDAELVERNLAAFARVFPQMHERLIVHRPLSRLVQDDEGNLDIEFRGKLLYGGNAKAVARKHVEAMQVKNDSRLRQTPPSTRNLDRQVSNYLYDLLQFAVGEGVTFLSDPPDQECFHLLLFGLGLGYHLVELCELTRAPSVCIVEPHFDFIYHSLAAIDWEPVLARTDKWRLAVTISEAQEAPIMAHAARHHCRLNNPCGLDWTLVAQSYANDSLQHAMHLLVSDAQHIQTGLGFFFDEMEMVRASYFNLVRRSDFRLIRTGFEQRPGLPAFIVGSGPSVDEDIDFLRDNQDRAVVFCCGSALGVLLSNGIKPDFEIILENGEQPNRMLEAMAARYDFGDTILLASNTVNPGMTDLFKETVYFIRPALSSFAIACKSQDNKLEDPSPTVTNTGLSAALQLGFADIYLFGTDLGSRRPERHHSAHSPYKMEGRRADYAKDDEIDYNFTMNLVALGNFGGVVFTDYIMAWARDSMEETLAHPWSGQAVYNCSDGARIKGTVAQTSASIKLPAPTRAKREVVRALIERFPEGSTIGYAEDWKHADWAAQVRALGAKVIAVCDAKPERTVDFVEPILRLMIPDIDRPARFEEFFLRGSVLMGLIVMDYYTHRVQAPEHRAKVRNRAYELFADMVRELQSLSDWFFEHLDEFPTATSLRQWFDQWDRAGRPDAA